ncbi:MAG: hypothetical protein C4562_06020 [Actinobacteria bacterium]|nr:MAG: hypothetical protein C4562_06020 [Actinomycetota bacterium]
MGAALPNWLTNVATYGQIISIFVGIIFQIGLIVLLFMLWRDLHKFIQAKVGINNTNKTQEEEK